MIVFLREFCRVDVFDELGLVKDIALSRVEARLLAALMARKGSVVEYAALHTAAGVGWETWEQEGSRRVIRVHMSNLRRKLDGLAAITNQSGNGYWIDTHDVARCPTCGRVS